LLLLQNGSSHLLALLGLGGCSRNGPVSFPFSTLHVTFGVKLLLLQQGSQ
jgi:hypothetical protein